MDLQSSTGTVVNEEVSDLSRLSSFQPQDDYGTRTGNAPGSTTGSRSQSGPYVGHQYEPDLHQTSSIRHEPQSPDLHADYIRQSSEHPQTSDSLPSRTNSPQFPGSSVDKPLPYAPQQYSPVPGREAPSQSPQQIPRKPIADKQSVLERPRAVSTQKYHAELPERTPFDRHRQSFEARPGRQTIYNPSRLITPNVDQTIVLENVQHENGQKPPYIDSSSQISRSDQQQALQQDPRAEATHASSLSPVNRQQRLFSNTSDLRGSDWQPRMTQQNPRTEVPDQRSLGSHQQSTERRPFIDFSEPSPFVEERALGPIAPETLPARPDTIKYGPRQLQREPSFNPHAPEPFSLENEIQPGHQQAYHKPLVVKDAPEAPSLKGVVDLSNTVDTSVHTNWAQRKRIHF